MNNLYTDLYHLLMSVRRMREIYHFRDEIKLSISIPISFDEFVTRYYANAPIIENTNFCGFKIIKQKDSFTITSE